MGMGKQNFLDVIGFKGFFGEFSIMRDFLFRVDIGKLLYIFQHNHIVFIVDTAEKTLEFVTGFEFDGNFVFEKFHNFFGTHEETILKY